MTAHEATRYLLETPDKSFSPTNVAIAFKMFGGIINHKGEISIYAEA